MVAEYIFVCIIYFFFLVNLLQGKQLSKTDQVVPLGMSIAYNDTELSILD